MEARMPSKFRLSGAHPKQSGVARLLGVDHRIGDHATGDQALQVLERGDAAHFLVGDRPIHPHTLAQVQELACRHQLPWATGSDGAQKLLLLLQVVSYRPGLVRPALYAMAQGDLSLEQLIEEAPTQSGIYSDHLRELLAALYPHPDLHVAFRHVIESAAPMPLEPIAAYRLESLGLVTLSKNLATPSCELYRQYFLAFLPPSLSSTYG
jgi:hypothetical protein